MTTAVPDGSATLPPSGPMGFMAPASAPPWPPLPPPLPPPLLPPLPTVAASGAPPPPSGPPPGTAAWFPWHPDTNVATTTAATETFHSRIATSWLTLMEPPLRHADSGPGLHGNPG